MWRRSWKWKLPSCVASMAASQPSPAPAPEDLRIALRVGRRGVIVNTSADWQNRAAERNSEGVRSLDAQEAWVPSRGRGR